MKTIIERNDAVLVLEKSTGLPYNELSDRIIRRVEKLAGENGNYKRRKSLQYFSVVLKVEMSFLLDKIFFKDEINDEVFELSKSIYLKSVKEVTGNIFKMLVNRVPFFSTELDWDNDVCHLDKKMIELEFGKVVLRFDLSGGFSKKGLSETRENDNEETADINDIQIDSLELYIGGEICFISDEMNEVLINKLISKFFI